MHEGLEFEVVGNLCAHPRDIGDGELARAHDALRAQAVPDLGRLRVGDARLRAHVQLELGHEPSCQGKRPQIAHDQRVHAGVAHGKEIACKLVEIGIVHDDVAGHVNGDTMVMGVFDGACELVEREVGRALAHAEAV